MRQHRPCWHWSRIAPERRNPWCRSVVATAGIVRFAVCMAVSAVLATACGSGQTSSASSPSAVAGTPTPAATESTPTPGNKPSLPPSLPADAQNPFHFSGPGGDPENLAAPAGLENLPPETDITKILLQIPATRLIAPADLARFRLTAAAGRRNSNGFGSSTYYIDDVQRQTLRFVRGTKLAIST